MSGDISSADAVVLCCRGASKYDQCLVFPLSAGAVITEDSVWMAGFVVVSGLLIEELLPDTGARVNGEVALSPVAVSVTGNWTVSLRVLAAVVVVLAIAVALVSTLGNIEADAESVAGSTIEAAEPATEADNFFNVSVGVTAV